MSLSKGQPVVRLEARSCLTFRQDILPFVLRLHRPAELFAQGRIPKADRLLILYGKSVIAARYELPASFHHPRLRAQMPILSNEIFHCQGGNRLIFRRQLILYSVIGKQLIPADDQPDAELSLRLVSIDLLVSAGKMHRNVGVHLRYVKKTL